MYILIADGGALSLLDNIRYFALNTIQSKDPMCALDYKFKQALLNESKSLDVVGDYDVVICRPDLYDSEILSLSLTVTRLFSESKAKENLEKILDYVHDMLAGQAIIAFINAWDNGVTVVVRIANGYLVLFEGRSDAFTAMIETFLFPRSSFRPIELK